MRLEQKLPMDRRKTQQENSWNVVELTEDTNVVAGIQQCSPPEDEIRDRIIFIRLCDGAVHGSCISLLIVLTVYQGMIIAGRDIALDSAIRRNGLRNGKIETAIEASAFGEPI